MCGKLFCKLKNFFFIIFQNFRKFLNFFFVITDKSFKFLKTNSFFEICIQI